ncbi:MAG TPA: thiamine pyridinylase [Solirubrobacterales bacterium]|jgi:thiamine pyridinylase|nr:thiamine pyridinylase [Solirubrobacterales bacterium]
MEGPARKGALGEAYQPPPPEPSGEKTLNVALYPYVPSPLSFVVAIELLWKNLRPDYQLNWYFYDCYHEEPPPTIDVFAFDCIYVDDLVAAAKVDPIAQAEIVDFADIMPFAVSAAAIAGQGGSFAGIPYLGCMSVLYHRAADKAFESPPLSIEALLKILGNAKYEGPEPGSNEGLLVDLGGKTTDACLYASCWRSETNSWWPTSMPMPIPPRLEPEPMGALRALRNMGGTKQAQFHDSGYARTNWFESGLGRALVGLTETMSGWSPETIDELRLCPLPISLGSDARKVPCYADAVGIRPGLGEEREAALQLANVISSVEVARLTTMSDGAHAQYLTPSRRSTLEELSEAPYVAARYKEIRQVLVGGEYEPVPFRLGKGVRAWAKPAGEAIIAELFPKAKDEPEAFFARPPRHHGYGRTPAGLWRRER